MKNRILLLLSFLFLSIVIKANDKNIIKISTNDIDLIYKIGDDKRLYQSYIGPKLKFESDLVHLLQGKEAYITHGMEDYFEPAIHIVHDDGNPSTLLKYVSHSIEFLDTNVKKTIIKLQDEKYPVSVILHYTAYANENIIATHSEIVHNENKTITLQKYASSMLHLNADKYFLREFIGDWANEANIKELSLEFGKKIIDSKLGARANMFCSPFFQLSLNSKVDENKGDVLVGTLGWTGNFSFIFEVDQKNELRIISGINSYASEYHLKPNEIFLTPEFYFTYSTRGVGQASRNFHDWARKYQVKDGKLSRMTLLNNWEATYFDFDEPKLENLMNDAVKLGVDMFLLDDGWFANKYPRCNDHQGLGDWNETKEKLPRGIGYLTKLAKQKGIKFGLWIEPEMVNPKSELYERHKDWVITLPNRKEYYFRNQLVLDLSNPNVQDYIFGVLDKLMTKYPEIAYFKWDCNSPITNVYSNYLKKNQSHLYIDYVRGLYRVLERIQDKYPNLPMMLCSGGGGRTDYEAMRFFTEFWPSDNTDPVERLFIQWGYTQIFPAKTICAHVTSWNKSTSVKFRTDVAMMCKLGFDIKLSDMNEIEESFCRAAIQNYNRLKPVILEGDMYKLISPYNNNHTSTMYVGKEKNRAVVFAFDIYPRVGDKTLPVRLQGLDANKIYRIKEINLLHKNKSSIGYNNQVFSGDYLMKVGINLFSSKPLQSRVLELVMEQ